MATKIEFKMDNELFHDAPHLEVARILRAIAARIAEGGVNDGGPVRDINGNTIGHWEFTKEQGAARAARRRDTRA